MNGKRGRTTRVVDEARAAAIARREIDDAELVAGPGIVGAVADGELAEFDGVSGRLLRSSGFTIAALLKAASAAVVLQVELELVRGRRSGVAYLEGVFLASQVGAPVVITAAPSGDEELVGILLFAGEIVDERRMRVAWWSPEPAPARVRVNLVLGGGV